MGRLAQTEGLSEIQSEILAAVHEFVEKEIIPNAQELEHADEYPAEIVEGMKAGFAKTPEYARKACAAAAQAKNGGLAGPGGPIPKQPAMKLPSGPL